MGVAPMLHAASNVCARREQHSHGVDVALPARPVQRRLAVAVFRLFLRAAREQPRHARRVVVCRRVHQPRHHPRPRLRHAHEPAPKGLLRPRRAAQPRAEPHVKRVAALGRLRNLPAGELRDEEQRVEEHVLKQRADALGVLGRRPLLAQRGDELGARADDEARHGGSFGAAGGARGRAGVRAVRCARPRSWPLSTEWGAAGTGPKTQSRPAGCEGARDASRALRGARFTRRLARRGAHASRASGRRRAGSCRRWRAR